MGLTILSGYTVEQGKALAFIVLLSYHLFSPSVYDKVVLRPIDQGQPFVFLSNGVKLEQHENPSYLDSSCTLVMLRNK